MANGFPLLPGTMPMKPMAPAAPMTAAQPTVQAPQIPGPPGSEMLLNNPGYMLTQNPIPYPQDLGSILQRAIMLQLGKLDAMGRPTAPPVDSQTKQSLGDLLFKQENK